jgi:hypothetical protein
VFRSAQGKGLTIEVDVPARAETEHAEENPHPVGG